MSIFISTGELSGDLYAADLATEFKKIVPEQNVWGMGGALAAGVKREWDNGVLHIMGLGRIVSSLPKLLKLREELARAVAKRNPAVAITVDSPDFHIPLAQKIREFGYRGPLVYVSPPTVWAWRPGRVKPLKRYYNICLTLFQFEAKFLKERGVPAEWYGHPLAEELAAYKPSTQLPSDPMRVALLPGSRCSEINTILPVLLAVAPKLQDLGCHPVLSVAPGLELELADRIRHNASRLPFTEASGRDLMAQSAFTIGASGTAIVESMLLGRWAIVLYRGTPLEWFIFQHMRHTPFVSFPNILAGREFYPELLQERMTPDEIINRAKRFMNDEIYRDGIDEQIIRNVSAMRRRGSIESWAKCILKLGGLGS